MRLEGLINGRRIEGPEGIAEGEKAYSEAQGSGGPGRQVVRTKRSHVCIQGFGRGIGGVVGWAGRSQNKHPEFSPLVSFWPMCLLIISDWLGLSSLGGSGVTI